MNENYLKKRVKQLKQQLNDALDGNTTRLNNMRAKLAHTQDELRVRTLQRDALLEEVQTLREVVSGEQEREAEVPADDLRVEVQVSDEEGGETRAAETVEEGAA